MKSEGLMIHGGKSKEGNVLGHDTYWKPKKIADFSKMERKGMS
jgi:hypothetical protein